MFSNFKLPSFLQRITSPSDSNQQTCKISSNINSEQYQHSMERFYTEFAILGEENKLKTVFAKKIATNFFGSNHSQAQQSSSQDNNGKAEILYLRKKNQTMRFIQIDKETYDHLAFKLIFFQEKQEKQLLEKLTKEIKYKSINKMAVFCRNFQLPVNYYVQQVNSVCSKHKQVYLVFKRWSMGLVDKLNQIIVKCIPQTDQPTLTNSFKKISLRNPTIQQPKPYTYKQSTTNASKHSSTIQGPTSPTLEGYNYQQSLVNQLNFDKVKSPKSLGQVSWDTDQIQSLISREFLILVKCAMRSLQFLKEQNSLPNDLNLASFLWDNKNPQPVHDNEVEKQVPQFSHHKKILTTLTNKFEISQSLANQSYLMVNSSIPKQSMAELLKQTQPKAPLLIQDHETQIRQTINKFIPLLSQLLSTSYPSPQELTQSFWQPELIYSSLLFKLGMTILDMWVVYNRIINQLGRSSSQDNDKNTQNKSVKELVYLSSHKSFPNQQRNDQIGKIDWLQMTQVINGIVSTQNRINSELSLLRKTLKLLLSRSAIERKIASNLVSSTQFISIMSGKAPFSEHTLSKASSNRTQTSQQPRNQYPIFMKKQSIASHSQHPEFKPISLSSGSVMSPNSLYDQSYRTFYQGIPKEYQEIKQKVVEESKSQQMAYDTTYGSSKQWQKATGPNASFDPRQVYFKVINENLQPRNTFDPNQTLSRQYQFSSNLEQYYHQNSARLTNQNSSFSPRYSQFTSTAPNVPSSSLTYSSSNLSSFYPSYTPSKESHKQTIITQSISVTYPSSNLSYSPYHQHNPLLTAQPESSKNLQSTSPYYTPTFVEETTPKTYMIHDSIKESPKPPVKLFTNSSNASERKSEITKKYEKNIEIQSLEFENFSQRESPVYDPQFKVQISSSEHELPSYLPESSSQRIDYYKKNSTSQNSENLKFSNKNILIQQDPPTSEKKSSTITQQLFASVKPNAQSTEILSSINNSTVQFQKYPSQSKIDPPSSEIISDLEQPRYVSEQYKGGGRYEGYVKNSKRHGYGRLDYHEGSRYEGDWLDDRMNGYGKLYYSNGNLAYQGYWVQDQFHGTGKVYNDNPTMLDDSFDYTNFNNLEEQWVHYEGELQHDLKEGHGVIMLENGEWFEGEFHNDRINGEGKFVNLEGEVIYGRWKDNIMIEEYTN